MLNVSQIATRLDAGYPAWQDTDSIYWEWDTQLDGLVNDRYNNVTESSIRAFLTFLRLTERELEMFTPEEFAEELTRRYKDFWSDEAKFARDVAAPDWADMGEHPSGRAEALEEFGDLIDWEAYTKLPEFTDRWVVIQMPGENGVHAFDAD